MSNIHTLAWLFDDGEPGLQEGRVQTYDGRLSGSYRESLKASARVLDALHYAASPKLYRVLCENKVVEREDGGAPQLLCRKRTILWSVDALPSLVAFARQAGEDAVQPWSFGDHLRALIRTGPRYRQYFRESRFSANYTRQDLRYMEAAIDSWRKTSEGFYHVAHYLRLTAMHAASAEVNRNLACMHRWEDANEMSRRAAGVQSSLLRSAREAFQDEAICTLIMRQRELSA